MTETPSRLRFIASEVLFWLHPPFVLIWVGLFFVPQSFWSSKVAFHFWFIFVVFAFQLIWGLILLPIRKRLGVGVCPLTTLTQKTRGFPISDPQNHDHVFIIEFCQRFNIPLKLTFLTKILLFSVFLVSAQYFFNF